MSPAPTARFAASTRSRPSAAGWSPSPKCRGSTATASATLATRATAAAPQRRSPRARIRATTEAAATYGVNATSAIHCHTGVQPPTLSTAHAANGATASPDQQAYAILT